MNPSNGGDPTQQELHELRLAVIELLGVRALPLDDIVEQVLIGGATRPRRQCLAALPRMIQFDASFSDVADGIVHVPNLLEGTAWTVWIDADDAQQGFVRTDIYLAALIWWLVSDDVSLVGRDGEVLGTLETDGLMLDGGDTDVVFGPKGWLDELAGGWATVVVSEGALRWMPCDEVPLPDGAQCDAIREGFARAVRAERDDSFGSTEQTDLHFASYGDPEIEALVLARDAFVATPIAPIPELYVAAGLEARRTTVAEVGFDWAALDAWRARNRFKYQYGVEPQHLDGLIAVIDACQLFEHNGVSAHGQGSAELAASALLFSASLDVGPVARGVWGECLARGVEPEMIGVFAATLRLRIDAVDAADTEHDDNSKRSFVGLAWLQAMAEEAADNASAACALLERAVSVECVHEPALLMLAGYLSDRGDAPAAYRLLQRAGIEHKRGDADSGYPLASSERDAAVLLLEEVEAYAKHRPNPNARRNDPCPCGSGRKYKACHLGNEQHSLDTRSLWLYDKATRFLRERGAELVDELAECAGDSADDDRIATELRDSPFIADLALHEEEVFAQFLRSRDSLLPDDEALLGAQWSLVDRSVFEVVGVRSDGVELLDLASGDRITVVNSHLGEAMKVGVLLCGRPLPVGDFYRAFSGFLRVERGWVAPLEESIESGDGFEVASTFGEMFRPPVMRNTEGHDLILHTLHWAVGAGGAIISRAEVEAALVAVGFEPADPSDANRWGLLRPGKRDARTLIASVSLLDGELVGEVNSDERAEELRLLIEQALPEANFLGDDRRSVEDARAARGSVGAFPDVEQSPELRAALEQFMRDQEDQWLDESIPALQGRTPRDAVTDPIGREMLVQLLDSFGPAPNDGEIGMNPDRLRAALGL